MRREPLPLCFDSSALHSALPGLLREDNAGAVAASCDQEGRHTADG